MEPAYTNEIIQFAKELIKIPTINPPGENYTECVSVIEEKCSHLGLETTIVECDGLPSIIGGDGKGILHFHSHYDVVGADISQFIPFIQDGNLYGRGSSDMKGGLAAMLYAIHEIDSPDITFSVTPDEEMGGIHGLNCLLEKSLLNPEMVLMPESSSSKIWHGCRGALSMDIKVKGKSAHSVYQHLGSNAFEEMLDVAQEFRMMSPGEGTLLLGGSLKGGTQFNMVPETCSFTIDWRFPPHQHLAETKERVFTLINTLKEKGKDIDSSILVETDGFSTSKEERICTVLAEAVQSIRGVSEFEICPGFLDLRYFAHKGIPSVAFGPGLLEAAHSHKEYIPIKDLLDAFTIFVLLGRSICSSQQ
jgi:succinyl-diaminopimelate desuccinylase